MTARTAHCLNHVGVSVPDIEAAVAWYQDVFSFTLIAAPLAACLLLMGLFALLLRGGDVRPSGD